MMLTNTVDNDKVFLLHSGMQQRLDGMRKHGFGIGAYFKSPKKALRGLYIARGPELPFSVSMIPSPAAAVLRYKGVTTPNVGFLLIAAITRSLHRLRILLLG